jgi:hypothetical protein
MLLSQAGNLGLVPPEPFGEKLQTQYPKSSPEDCLLDTSFDAFLNSGVYRSGTCVPAASITQERTTFRSAGKIAWKETTDTDILKEHQKLLKSFQVFVDRGKEPKYEKVEAKEESDLRKQVRAILEDQLRTDEDKADSIEKIVKELTSNENKFTDSSGILVVCQHTLAILKRRIRKGQIKIL